jgi:hypothetical protein
MAGALKLWARCGRFVVGQYVGCRDAGDEATIEDRIASTHPWKISMPLYWPHEAVQVKK